MVKSIAYKEFLQSLEIAKALIQLDTYKVPPKQKHKKYVYGLRGGSAILIVASFEEFLNRLPDIHLDVIKRHTNNIDFSKLPDKLIITNVDRTLKQSSLKKDVRKLADAKNACRSIINDEINTAVFKLQGFNPTPRRIINLFNVIGVNKIFEHITKRFQRGWQKRINTNLIKGKLSEIINRRNNVAHKTSLASQITKNDLNEAINFLRILARQLDITYKKQINNICISAKK